MSQTQTTPTQSRDAYAGAINRLVLIAQQDTSGSRAAAQVLLSAYNGDNWQLNITDLVVLDDDNYHAALLVMFYRRSLMEEPHTLIENGEQVFGELQQQWQRYHVSNRHKSECYTCDGIGKSRHSDYEKTCESCDGSGLVVRH